MDTKIHSSIKHGENPFEVAKKRMEIRVDTNDMKVLSSFYPVSYTFEPNKEKPIGLLLVSIPQSILDALAICQTHGLFKEYCVLVSIDNKSEGSLFGKQNGVYFLIAQWSMHGNVLGIEDIRKRVRVLENSRKVCGRAISLLFSFIVIMGFVLLVMFAESIVLSVFLLLFLIIVCNMCETMTKDRLSLIFPSCHPRNLYM